VEHAKAGCFEQPQLKHLKEMPAMKKIKKPADRGNITHAPKSHMVVQ